MQIYREICREKLSGYPSKYYLYRGSPNRQIGCQIFKLGICNKVLLYN